MAALFETAYNPREAKLAGYRDWLSVGGLARGLAARAPMKELGYQALEGPSGIPYKAAQETCLTVCPTGINGLCYGMSMAQPHVLFDN